MSESARWQPSASADTLRLRAGMLAAARAFFAERDVLEVDTPALVHHAVTDRHLHAAEVHLPGHGEPLYLHTSPEYAMKRLLAAGTGDIYQIAHVFRGEEASRWHNAEFMMIEWYRCGFSMQQLMQEVAALCTQLLGLPGDSPPEYLSFAQAFEREVGLRVLEADAGEVRAAAERLGLERQLAARCSRDELLDWLVASRIGPALGTDRLCFLHRYPASQAALARLDADDPRVALRFELYYRGVELANGFEELADEPEQRARFERDRQERQALGLPVPRSDEFLLAALAAGMPAASGVALGFDRLVMLRSGANELAAVMPFPLDRA